MQIGVFVNASLLFYVVQSKFRSENPTARINYTTYLKQATGQDNLYRAIAYGAHIQNEANGFIECLQQAGFETRYVAAKERNGKRLVLETDRNLEMATDIFRIVQKLDKIVIGSNDVTLIPLIKFLQERGVKVVIFAARVPRELVKAADEVIEIEEDVLEVR